MNIRKVKKRSKQLSSLNSLIFILKKWNAKMHIVSLTIELYKKGIKKMLKVVWIDDINEEKPKEVIING